MVGPKNTFMARASLIDRLVDNDPKTNKEPRPLRTISKEELKESVRRELGWLLNTRTSISTREFDARDLTVIDYGMPDFGSYSPAHVEDQMLLAKRIARAISAFESRLQDVKVTVELEMANERTLRVSIDAVLVSDMLREPVSFLTVLQAGAGLLEVLENEY
jgi:type VI secretion system protein ImpF